MEKDKRIHITLPDEVHAYLIKVAKKEHRTLTNLTEMIIIKWVRNNEL